jgi:hypothetical protein
VIEVAIGSKVLVQMLQKLRKLLRSIRSKQVFSFLSGAFISQFGPYQHGKRLKFAGMYATHLLQFINCYL